MSIDQFRAKVDGNRSEQDRLAAVRAEAPDKILAGLQRLEARVQKFVRSTPELKASVIIKIYTGPIPHDPEDDWGYKYYPDNGALPHLSIVAFSRWSIMSLVHNPYTDHWFKPHYDYPYESEQAAYEAIMAELAQWVANYPKHLEENALADKRVKAAEETAAKERNKALDDQLNKRLIIIVSIALFVLLIYLS